MSLCNTFCTEIWVAYHWVIYSDLCGCFFLFLFKWVWWGEGKDALVFEEALWFPCTKFLMLCATITPVRTAVWCCPGKRRVNLPESSHWAKGKRGNCDFRGLFWFMLYVKREAVPKHTIAKHTILKHTILLPPSLRRFQGVSGNRAGPQLCLSSLDVRYACNVLCSWNLFQGQRNLPSVYVGLRHILLAKFIRWLVLTVVTVDWLGNIYLCYNYLIS